MKTRLPIVITACLCCAALILLLAACSRGGERGDQEPATEPAAMLDSAAAPAEAGVSHAGGTDEATLPDLGPAPAWQNETWINSERPLRLEDLRGKVILLEFWTFG